jgi:hypothetical protein
VMLEFADAFAKRLCAEQPTLDGRIQRGYALLYQRQPTAREKALATAFLTGRDNDTAAWSQYAQALLGSNEVLFVD